VLCSAGSYDGHPLTGAARFVVWANNACLGKQKLNSLACDQKLLPSHLGEVQCVPDTSGGNCPPPPVPCSAGGKPMTCAAESYGGQKLTGDLSLSAAGVNECAATAALWLAACRQNLNPKQLQGITCHPDASNGECPPSSPPCSGPNRGAHCTARRLGGRILAKPLEANGDTACEAKLELARQACRQAEKPSTLDDVTCMFDK
jgi:hypothetical protein